METILVTGGAGFIGGHLAERLLADGKRVVVLDDFNDFYDPKIKRQTAALLKSKGAVIHECDIRDSAALENIFSAEKIDAVVHLAARAGVRPSIADPLLYAEVNITGTLNVLEQCRKHGVKRFIFGSSSSVYGVTSKVPFAEGDAVQPISPYATTKIAGEQYCKVYAQLFGMRITCLRFFTVYGPRGRPDMAVHKFTSAIVAGKPIELYGDGMQRDFTYVSDIVDGIAAALEKNCPFEIINLGDSNPISVKQLIELIEKTVGKKAVVTQLPEQPGDVPITYADLSTAKRLLGYAPKVEIGEGVKRFVEWFSMPH